MRAVTDANLWVNFLFGKKVADLLTLIQTSKIEVVTNARQIAEIEALTVETKENHRSAAPRNHASFHPSQDWIHVEL